MTPSTLEPVTHHPSAITETYGSKLSTHRRRERIGIRIVCSIAAIRSFKPRQMFRTASSWNRWPVVVLLSLMFAGGGGCGDGFTGGSIPPGRSAVIGVVVHAENPQIPVANATVTIITTPPSKSTRDTLTYRVLTDSHGAFEVSGIPTGATQTDVTMIVTDSSTLFQSQSISFILTKDRTTDVIAALPPSSIDLTKVNKVLLIQESGSTITGASAQFKAEVLDINGNNLGILPTLVLDGSLGIVGQDGAFVVTPNTNSGSAIVPDAGLGYVTATFDNNTSNKPATTVTPVASTSGSVQSTSGQTSTGSTSPPQPPAPPSG